MKSYKNQPFYIISWYRKHFQKPLPPPVILWMPEGLRDWKQHKKNGKFAWQKSFGNSLLGMFTLRNKKF